MDIVMKMTQVIRYKQYIGILEQEDYVIFIKATHLMAGSLRTDGKGMYICEEV